jgi:dienelactone hydrolase
MRLLPVVVFLVAVLSPAAGQTTDVVSRWFKTERDSVLVDCVLPGSGSVRPAVLVLSDRFGAQENARAVLKVLGRLGYRAYALPLRSAPLRSIEGIPEATLDSTDSEILTQVAVDIMNDSSCTGSIGLLGFDVGAAVAVDVLRRFPFFSSAALFYPSGGLATLMRLLPVEATVQLHIAQFDPQCTLAEVNEMRDRFVEARKRLHVFYYKDAFRFFFNPQHKNYHRSNTQAAWNRLNAFFRKTL